MQQSMRQKFNNAYLGDKNSTHKSYLIKIRLVDLSDFASERSAKRKMCNNNDTLRPVNGKLQLNALRNIETLRDKGKGP